MVAKIRLQTADGVREYKFVPHAAALQAAADAGEVGPGEEIIYREYLVWVLGDSEMLILDRVQMAAPVFGGGMAGPEFAPPVDGMQWHFTVNGQPVTPEQAEQFMGGGFARN